MGLQVKYDFSYKDLTRAHNPSLTLRKNILHRLLPKSVQKYENCGQIFIYAHKNSTTVTEPVFTKLSLDLQFFIRKSVANLFKIRPTTLSLILGHEQTEGREPVQDFPPSHFVNKDFKECKLLATPERSLIRKVQVVLQNMPIRRTPFVRREEKWK